jgi:cobalt-zinc-cadmium efflux system protein
VIGWPVVVTALAGIGINLLVAWSIGRANRTSLNVEGAYQHILNDLFGFIATAIAGVIIILTGFHRADAIASLVVVALMVKAGFGLLRDSTRIFLEAAPAGIHPDDVADRLLAQPSIVEVHDLHVWVITSNQPALSAHVLVEPSADCHAARLDLERLLAGEFHITHTTLQVDHVEEQYLQISPRAGRQC